MYLGSTAPQEAAEMWFLRRMLKIPWPVKRSNEEVLKEAEEKRQAGTKFRKRHSKFTEQVRRAGGLEHLITTGMIESKGDLSGQSERR